MIVGIDVGGTNTDAALVDRDRVLHTVKVATDHEQYMSSIINAVEELLSSVTLPSIEEIHLSTTLSTNLLIENKQERTGVVTAAGPGIHPAHFRIGDDFEIVEGAIDHRGVERTSLDEDRLGEVVREFVRRGIRVCAAVTKFSPRNPVQENRMARMLADSADFITAGHTISGALNFPRRLYSSYFNASIWRVFNTFVEGIRQGMEALSLSAPLRMVKADGGTMPIAYSRHNPVQTILSGPATSVIGALGLNHIQEDRRSGEGLRNRLDREVTVSPYHATANAIGAALTKATFGIELFADTQQRRLSIPELGVTETISSSYTLEQAKNDAERFLTELIAREGFASGVDAVEITETNLFPMMDWMTKLGDNIRVKAQLHPDISSRISFEEEEP